MNFANNSSKSNWITVYAFKKPEFNAERFEISAEVLVPNPPQRHQSWKIGVSSVILILTEDFTIRGRGRRPEQKFPINPTAVYLSCNFAKSISEKESGAISYEEVPLASFILSKEIGIDAEICVQLNSPVFVPLTEFGNKTLKFNLRTPDKVPVKCVNPRLAVLAHMTAE